MKIDAVKDNYEKEITYREVNKKMEISFENKNYYEVITLLYSMIEDRMKSLFYYLYLLDDKNDSFLQKKLIVL